MDGLKLSVVRGKVVNGNRVTKGRNFRGFRVFDNRRNLKKTYRSNKLEGRLKHSVIRQGVIHGITGTIQNTTQGTK